MSVPAHNLCLSVDEYLQFEEASKERHEYVAGRVFAMAGASDAHNQVVGNLHRDLYDPVTESGCHVYMSDMKLWIEALQSFYYPDIMVTCESFVAAAIYKTAPCLIIEVLSPSTQAVDRREKLLAYRHLPSLVEYVLIYQDKLQVEIYRKDRKGNWQCSLYQGQAKVTLKSLQAAPIVLDTERIYRRIKLDT